MQLLTIKVYSNYACNSYTNDDDKSTLDQPSKYRVVHVSRKMKTLDGADSKIKSAFNVRYFTLTIPLRKKTEIIHIVNSAPKKYEKINITYESPVFFRLPSAYFNI
ncbi:CLUMA_CG003486, isoform A [Clunio marinus]|uniref:CLUMA_CG003486, isoform A n=1 Tax=Clunio marinus TaxID=568069 RepID=A0A1J1HP72_9DIPT|nr:CLUMA_CG003486, isoform A [Clunio marinus]